MSLVAVAPERDTPAVMAEPMTSFDPRIVAVTGSRDEAVRSLGAVAGRSAQPNGGYGFGHPGPGAPRRPGRDHRRPDRRRRRPPSRGRAGSRPGRAGTGRPDTSGSPSASAPRTPAAGRRSSFPRARVREAARAPARRAAGAAAVRNRRGCACRRSSRGPDPCCRPGSPRAGSRATPSRPSSG
ncbi:SCO family protein [Methylobacterium crusticola]|uniref:SCO family protein n=1 Tax=Methylobacterium crusticola TaxID=1697972 RepID=UPI0034D45710